MARRTFRPPPGYAELPPAAFVHRARLTHLDHLDGVRGLAALFVVLHHAWLLTADRFPIAAETGLLGLLTNWLLYGHLAVDVFIVLSGFCLMLPVARSGDALAGGARGFFVRRARRILPPYFAALAVSVALTAGLQAWNGDAIHLNGGDLLANALLLQDVLPQTALAFNPPFWSVAVEWKIYFLFPLLVLILNRAGKRRRPAVLLLTAALGYGIVDVVLTLAPHLPLSELAHSCPWYVFLFGMGVCAGSVAAAAPKEDDAAGERRKWVGVAAMSYVLLAVLLAAFGWRRQESDLSRYFPIIDAVAGAFTASLLIVLGVGPAEAGPLRRALSTTPLVRAGTWAYSLYLLHFPLLRLLTERMVKPLLPDAGRVAHFGALALFGVPLVLLASWAFFRVVERPFLSRSPSGPDEDARRAALSPAP